MQAIAAAEQQQQQQRQAQANGHRPSRAGPVKLRAACNRCTQSKVKCSGEKTGCERCRNGGLPCHYEESRVGKVQGPRGSRRKSTHPTASSMDSPDAPMISPRATPQQSSTASSLFEGAQDPFLHGSSDFFTGYGWTNVATTSVPESASISAPMDLQGLQSADTPTSTTSTSLISPNARRAPRRSRVDGEAIIACSNLIKALETYIQQDLKSPELIADVADNAVRQLAQIVEIHGGQPSDRCMSLLVIVFDGVVELYESASSIAAMEQRDTRHMDTSESVEERRLRMLRNLGSGGFQGLRHQPDCHQKLHRQVNFAIDIIQKLRASTQRMGRGGSGDVEMRAMHDLRQLVRRLEDLHERWTLSSN